MADEEVEAVPQDDDSVRRRQEEAMEQMLLAQEAAEEEENEEAALLVEEELPVLPQRSKQPFRLPYTTTSFAAAWAVIWYALRTREQWYLALVYLNSSKWAYIVFGNALIAACVVCFRRCTNFFLNGLRLIEAEQLGDQFRWNITETCLALTMFRSELNVETAVWFLILVLAKCLHWCAEMREGHLRVTQEAVVPIETGWFRGAPVLQWAHAKLFFFLLLLQALDLVAVFQCCYDIYVTGRPSVSMFFGFEATILLTSAFSSILLWHLHVLDGWLHFLHDHTDPSRWSHRWIHPWKEYKATLTFAVEVQAQAAKFFFYVTFFCIVLSYYGMPIHLLREVYVCFQGLKQRLYAFANYRKLMADMNRFQNCSDEELEEAGRTCIICRDEMDINDCKKLPGCGHIFHTSCLRDWLVQQQSCPTCRGDITAMQMQQERADLLAANAAEEQRVAVEETPEEEHQEPPQQQQQQEEPPNLTQEPPATREAPACIPQEKPSQQLQQHEELAQERATPNTASVQRELEQTTAVSTMMEETEEPPEDLAQVEADAGLPALYVVLRPSGAPVRNENEVIVRTVAPGKIVLCTELDCRQGDRIVLKMPDGWVELEHVGRISNVQL